jgi:Fe-S cluster biogenesis protein NfuA
MHRMSKSHASTTSPAALPEDLLAQVRGVLDLIRPAVQSDGGDVELVGVTGEGVVEVRLHGACVGCPSSAITLQTGIERSLRQRVPGVTAVRAVA